MLEGAHCDLIRRQWELVHIDPVESHADTCMEVIWVLGDSLSWECLRRDRQSHEEFSLATDLYRPSWVVSKRGIVGATASVLGCPGTSDVLDLHACSFSTDGPDLEGLVAHDLKLATQGVAWSE